MMGLKDIVWRTLPFRVTRASECPVDCLSGPEETANDAYSSSLSPREERYFALRVVTAYFRASSPGTSFTWALLALFDGAKKRICWRSLVYSRMCGLENGMFLHFGDYHGTKTGC